MDDHIETVEIPLSDFIDFEEINRNNINGVGSLCLEIPFAKLQEKVPDGYKIDDKSIKIILQEYKINR